MCPLSSNLASPMALQWLDRDRNATVSIPCKNSIFETNKILFFRWAGKRGARALLISSTLGYLGICSFKGAKNAGGAPPCFTVLRQGGILFFAFYLPPEIVFPTLSGAKIEAGGKREKKSHERWEAIFKRETEEQKSHQDPSPRLLRHPITKEKHPKIELKAFFPEFIFFPWILLVAA